MSASAAPKQRRTFPKVCSKCQKPWRDKYHKLRIFIYLTFGLSGIILLGPRDRYGRDDREGLLAELAMSGQIPMWPLHVLAAIMFVSLFAVGYFEFIKTDREYKCKHCGNVEYVPKRQWTMTEKVFATILVGGLSIFAALLITMVLVA
jgi:hypothetical protein